MKKVIGLVIAPVVVFLLSYLYVLGLDFSREWAFWGIVNTTVVAPFIFVGIIGACAASFLGKNVSMAAVSGLICGIAGEYGNLVFSIHSAFDVWIWNSQELIQAARMLADMHEIRVLFIGWTGSGLAFMYWIEAAILVLGAVGVAYSVASDGGKKESSTKERESVDAGKVATAMLVLGMGLLMTGCSSDEQTNKLPDEQTNKLPDEQAVSAWVSKQDWKQYEIGKTFRKESLNGETYIGVGITVVPETEKLKKANLIRTKVLAMRAILNEIEIEDPSNVAVILDDVVEVSGEQRLVIVLATRFGNVAGENIASPTMDFGFFKQWIEKQDWTKYNDGVVSVMDGDYVFGVSVTDEPMSKNDKLKARMMAKKAILKGLNAEQFSGVIVPVYSDVKEIRGAKKFITVMAAKSNGAAK